MKTLSKGAAAALRALLALLGSAQVWLLVLVLGGSGLLLDGVYLLAGQAWTLVAAGAIGLLGAVFLMIGIARG